MRSRSRIPLYARHSMIVLSGSQVKQIWKRGNPWNLSDLEYVKFVETRDGSMWASKEPGAIVFWFEDWLEIPKIVGQRVKAIDTFVKSL